MFNLIIVKMKKLVFATALTIGSFATISAAASTPIFHDGIMEAIMAGEFTEINVSEVPAAISEALAADYLGATITKAYKNEEAQFKIEIIKEDGAAAVLHADAEGNWIDL